MAVAAQQPALVVLALEVLAREVLTAATIWH